MLRANLSRPSRAVRVRPRHAAAPRSGQGRAAPGRLSRLRGGRQLPGAARQRPPRRRDPRLWGWLNGLKGHSVASAGPLVPERLGDSRIIREIGRGGMGFVYEAEQVSLGRRSPLKVLPRHALLDPESVERFRRESATVAGLHHTNIVQIFGTGEHDGLHYFVMELIGGVGLNRVMRELKQTRAAYQPEPTIGRAAAPEDSRKAVSMTTRQAASLDPSIMAVVRGLLSGTSAGSGPGTSANRDGLPAQGPDAPAEPPASPSSSGSGRPYWIRVARVGMQIAEALATCACLRCRPPRYQAVEPAPGLPRDRLGH